MRAVLQHETGESGEYCTSCHNRVGNNHNRDCLIGLKPAYENRMIVQIAVTEGKLYALTDDGLLWYKDHLIHGWAQAEGVPMRKIKP